MYETFNGANSEEEDNSEKWGQIFGLAMMWLVLVGIILVFTVPADTVSVVLDYSAAGVK